MNARRSLFAVGLAVVTLVCLVLYQQRTRTIEGTWIDLFEGSSFFEGRGIEWACSPHFRSAPWFSYDPKTGSSEHDLVKANRNSGVFVSEHGTWSVAAYTVKFVGHQNILGLGFGHLSASPSEFEVERMISIVPIENVRCDVRD